MQQGFQQFLQGWFNEADGKEVFAAEQNLIANQLHNEFGYFLLQVGRISEQDLLAKSRIKTKVIVDKDFTSCPLPSFETGQAQPGLVVADLDFLPFKTDSFDLVLLPHTLEAVADPYHLVRQIDSILRAQGRLIISGFNPWSWKVLQMKFSRQSKEFAQAHLIKMHRVIDWLNLLGYDIKIANYSANQGWLAKILQKLRLPQGVVYILVAEKRVASSMPVGLDWKLANWLPVRKGVQVAANSQGTKKQAVELESSQHRQAIQNKKQNRLNKVQIKEKF